MPDDVQVTVWQCPFESRGVWRRLANLIAAATVRADITHITGDVHYLALVLRKRRTVLTIHDCISLERTQGWRRAILRLFWYTLPIRRSGAVVAISECAKRQILSHVACSAEKIRVIHDCVSAEFGRSDKVFDRDCPRILFVGTTPNKNLERTIESLAGIECRLIIIGRLSADQQRKLEQHRVPHELKVDLSDEALRLEYERSDMLLFPSTYEGFGLPIIEAQTVGRPVVTSNVSSMPEVAGAGACLVDPWNPDSIRQGVLRVVRDDSYRDQVVAEGFQNVRRFRPEAVANQYAKLYREMVANRT
jgi:glycosyltransferase involved in cell wall biosynthesis